MNRHFAWMIPIAQLAVFLACGLPVAILAVFRPALARRTANLLFCTLGCFSLMLIIKGLYPTAAGLLAVGLGSQVARLIRADNNSAFRRFQRISLPVLLGSVAVIGAVSYERLVLEEHRGLASLSASAPGSQRAPGRARYGPCRPAEPVWLWPRHHAQPHPAGGARSRLRRGAVGGSLDTPLAR